MVEQSHPLSILNKWVPTLTHTTWTWTTAFLPACAKTAYLATTTWTNKSWKAPWKIWKIIISKLSWISNRQRKSKSSIIMIDTRKLWKKLNLWSSRWKQRCIIENKWKINLWAWLDRRLRLLKKLIQWITWTTYIKWKKRLALLNQEKLLLRANLLHSMLKLKRKLGSIKQKWQMMLRTKEKTSKNLQEAT